MTTITKIASVQIALPRLPANGLSAAAFLGGVNRERGERQASNDQQLLHGVSLQNGRESGDAGAPASPAPVCYAFRTAIMPTTTANSVAPSIMAAVMIIAVEI